MPEQTRTLPAALAALLLTATPAPAQPAPPLAGGWSQTEVTPQIRKAATFAVKQLPHRHAHLKSIDSARQQVVAGMNYEMDLMLTDRTRWKVRVWAKLDGGMELTSAVRILPPR